MRPATPLQQKIGGPTSALDRAGIIAAAERNLASVAPLIEATLLDYRVRIREAAGTAPLDLQVIFTAAHQIRGLAGTIGRPSIGTLADALATYITVCADTGTLCSMLVVHHLAAALDRAYDLKEGDPILIEALAISLRMTEAFSPAPRAGGPSKT